MYRKTFPALALCFILSALGASADVAVPKNILEPATAAEAWNVIRLATKNLETLLGEKRTDELATQVSLCSPALRTLTRLASSPADKAKLDELTVRAFSYINSTAAGGIAKDLPRAEAGYASLRTVLDEMAKLYDPKVVKADIYFCPMHPEFIAADPKTVCDKCGMTLLPRRIPYSFIYTTPGAPSLKLTATVNEPPTAGEKATVKVRLEQQDGKPVLPADLLVMHTQRIHLLIVDPSLGDYHHEHPVSTEIPGEYTFSFIPKKTAPYRIWADVVPTVSGIQEYPSVDLPSKGTAEPITDRSDSYTSTAGGLNFRLSFEDRRGARPQARETRYMKVMITDQAGQPVKNLAPVMNAFAHLVGFYDDYRTVVHFHPEGGEILRDDLRGGPAMGFRFFPPKAGFLRLYCQVLVEGQMIFAPFALNIGP